MNPNPPPHVLGRSALLLAFLGVHFALAVVCLASESSTFGDVSIVYRDWVAAGLDGEGWRGLDTIWVYPTAALAPMLAAAALGLGHFSVAWLILVTLLDVGALWVLTRGGRRHLGLGWWWLLFLALLGPVGVGRIDAITVPLAIMGVVALGRRPVLAGVLLSAAAWMKIWPVALLASAVIAGPRRALVVIGALVTTLGVLLVAVAVGAHPAVLFGFVGEQTGRGLQLEAPVSTLWLWLAAYGVEGVEPVFNSAINTMQIAGPGSDAVSSSMTPVMAAVLVGIAALGLLALRRGTASTALFGPLGLAFTSALIVTNKVGSPQFESWLVVPVLAGLLLTGSRFVAPAVLVSVVALLTQLVYPIFYSQLVAVEPWIVGVITLRNALLVVTLAWAVAHLWRFARPKGTVSSSTGSEIRLAA